MHNRMQMQQWKFNNFTRFKILSSDGILLWKMWFKWDVDITVYSTPFLMKIIFLIHLCNWKCRYVYDTYYVLVILKQQLLPYVTLKTKYNYVVIYYFLK